MTLLKLAPDSERLRRIARAYAAGEMDEDEYRRIRAEVIAGFVVADTTADDTQQRWPLPPVERMNERTDEPDTATPQPPALALARFRRTAWLVGALAAAVTSIGVYLVLSFLG